MAEHKGVKAPEKTAEGLRRVNVVLYDTDPTSSPASPVASSGGRPACAAGGGSVPTVVTSRRHTSEPGTYL
jgi:hypothetical protein